MAFCDLHCCRFCYRSGVHFLVIFFCGINMFQPYIIPLQSLTIYTRYISMYCMHFRRLFALNLSHSNISAQRIHTDSAPICRSSVRKRTTEFFRFNCLESLGACLFLRKTGGRAMRAPIQRYKQGFMHPMLYAWSLHAATACKCFFWERLFALARLTFVCFVIYEPI